jgi:DNA-binding transcriptional MerR regulator
VELKRQYYSAVQTARLLGVKPHVLRYWESRFEIRPQRNSAGRRIYTREQVDKLAQIKFLRYHEKMTVNGTRRKLERIRKVTPGSKTEAGRAELLLWLEEEITALRDLLGSNEAEP